jgi:SH3-like domain-containing protein
MSSFRLSAVIFCGLSLAASISSALEFKSVANAPAIMFDAPSQKGKKVFIAPRGMPVEIVLTYGEWSKVRDASGGLAWLESKALSNKRNVLVQVVGAKIRATPDEAAFIVFTAEKGVLLELGEPPVSGWLKVKHRDGLTGYVKVSEIWGI